MKKVAIRKRELPLAAWKFGDVPTKEIEACYLYEYSKELPEIVREVAALVEKMRRQPAAMRKLGAWLKINPPPSGNRDDKAWQHRMGIENPGVAIITDLQSEVHFLTDLACSKIFPERHWLEIAAERRKQVSRLLQPGRPRWGYGRASQESRPLFIQTLQSFLEWKAKYSLFNGTLDHHSGPQVFDVCWARSDRKLKADFGDWLKENRSEPAYHASPHGGSRKTTPRDLLKALGAFRIMQAFDSDCERAAHYTRKLLGDGTLYNAPKEWRAAVVRAEKGKTAFLRQMLPANRDEAIWEEVIEDTPPHERPRLRAALGLRVD